MCLAAVPGYKKPLIPGDFPFDEAHKRLLVIEFDVHLMSIVRTDAEGFFFPILFVALEGLDKENRLKVGNGNTMLFTASCFINDDDRRFGRKTLGISLESVLTNTLACVILLSIARVCILQLIALS